MALDMQERHAFEHEEGRSPVWIGMAWGAVSLLGGVALLAAMLTFDVREIGWSYLNGSGLVIPGTSNVLGTAGLYGAGIFIGCWEAWPGCWLSCWSGGGFTACSTMEGCPEAWFTAVCSCCCSDACF